MRFSRALRLLFRFDALRRSFSASSRAASRSASVRPWKGLDRPKIEDDADGEDAADDRGVSCSGIVSRRESGPRETNDPLDSCDAKDEALITPPLEGGGWFPLLRCSGPPDLAFTDDAELGPAGRREDTRGAAAGTVVLSFEAGGSEDAGGLDLDLRVRISPWTALRG